MRSTKNRPAIDALDMLGLDDLNKPRLAQPQMSSKNVRRIAEAPVLSPLCGFFPWRVTVYSSWNFEEF
jgi:hypothetical protein